MSFTPQGNLHGSYTGSLSSVAQTLQSVLALGNSEKRNGVVFYNDTNVGNAVIAYNTTASLSSFTTKIAPSASFVMSPTPYCGPVAVTWDASGAGNLRITEVL